jgi:hypothetical protein
MPLKRRGLPDPSSVVMEIPFAPAGVLSIAAAASAPPQYRILRTNEVDQYEAAPPRIEVARSLERKSKPSELFSGKSRRAAKLSVSKAKTEKFADLADLVGSLVKDKVMRTKGITRDPTSKRVAEEERNVRVEAFLYAASRENDNDYHLIIGRDRDAGGKVVYLTMELSGLPAASAKSRAALEAARKAFNTFFAKHFGGNLPGGSYDFYDPPIRIQVEGSLFWDASHGAENAPRPGPDSLRAKMPTVWEVHPISKIKLFPPATPPQGLPALASIVEEKAFISSSGQPYRVLRTSEVDEYEER